MSHGQEVRQHSETDQHVVNSKTNLKSDELVFVQLPEAPIEMKT